MDKADNKLQEIWEAMAQERLEKIANQEAPKRWIVNFRATPIAGRSIEQKIGVATGYIICIANDPESFLRDRLGEQSLDLESILLTSVLTEEGLRDLPLQQRSRCLSHGWCIWFLATPPE